MRRRVLSAFSAAVVLVCAVAVVVNAASASGFKSAQVILRDEGVWVTRGADKSVGYISKASYRLEVKFGASELNEVELAQGAQTLLLREDPLGRVQVRDSRTATVIGALEKVDGAIMRSGGGVAALIRPASGAVRVAPVTNVQPLAAVEGQPAMSVGATAELPATLGVGLDGSVHVVSVKDATVTTISPTGVVGGAIRLASVDAGAMDISAAGAKPLVLNRKTGLLMLPNLVTADLSGYGDHPVLQQPSDDLAVALVATDTALLEVQIRSGKVTKIGDGTGGAAAPVRIGGKSFGAWSDADSAYRVDPDGSVVVYEDSELPNGRLVWRVGTSLVVLNNVATGGISLQDDDGTVRALGDDDWQRALQKTENEDTQSGDTGTSDSSTEVVEQTTEAQQVPPVPAPDNDFGTRVGRSVTIPVLANDTDANGDVLVVTGVSADVVGGTAGVVSNGAAVEFTSSGTESGSFTYTVSDGVEAPTGSVSVKVYPADPSGDQPPKRLPKKVQADDVAEVGNGSTFELDLLRGWFDPEGDAFSLSAPPVFEPESAAGWFSVEPSGRLSGRTYAAGDVKATFTVVDEYGATSQGTFTIKASDDMKVQAFPDTVFARVGETAVVDVLANDLGADLRVGKTTASDQRVRSQSVDAGRRMSVRATEFGQYTITYEVRPNGSVDAPVIGQVRLVVPDPALANLPPVAGSDLVVAKPGVGAVVDVLHNDSDPNADVLIVTDAKSDVPGAAEIQVIDNKFVRVLVDDFPAVEPSRLLIRYRVSDGTNATDGTLVVVRDQFGGDRPPTLRDDVKVVRGGGIVRIPVLSNDSDADSVLHLDGTDPVTPGEGGGEWSANGDEIVFIAPATAGDAKATYRVDGSQATGSITVSVRDPNQPGTTLDQLPDTTARAVQGQTITIQLPLDVDPDGDPLVLTGRFTPSDRPLGTLQPLTDEMRDGNYVVYQAEATKQGLDHVDYVVQEQYGDKPEVMGRIWIGVAKPESAVNAPVANPDVAWVKPGETRRIDVLKNDTPSGLVQLGAVSAVSAEFGTATRDGDVLVYTAPDDGAEAQYTLRYRAELNGLYSSGTVTVFVTSQPPNLAPTVQNGIVRLAPGATGSFDALARADDPDGDRSLLTLAVPNPPAGVTFAGGTITIANAASPGPTVVFTVTDEGGRSTKGFVRFEVDNLAPVSSWVTPAPVDGNEPITVDLRTYITDPDGVPDAQAWTLVDVTDPTQGVVQSVAGDVVTFVPNADTKNAQFTANVIDSKNRTFAAIFNFVVLTNQPPRPVPVNVTVASKSVRPPIVVTIDPGDTDEADAGKIDITGTCQAPAGFTVQHTGVLQLTISTDQPKGASATVTCTVEDSRAKQAPAVVNVSVGPTDRDRPSANPLTFELRQGDDGGGPVMLAIPLSDPLQNGVTVEAVGSPAPATASFSGGGASWNLTITPPATDFSGQISFGYRVTDSEERTVEATVTILVKGRPKPPGKPVATAGDKTVTVTWPPSPPNGVPIANYTVQASSGASQVVSGTSATFPNLVNETAYTFTVVANPTIADWGTSPASPASDAATPDAAPAQPVSFAAARGDKVVNLSWAPGDAGTISGFVVECDQCGGAPKTTSPGQTSVVWDSLTNGTTYTFTLTTRRTLKSTGEQAASPPVQTSAKPAGKPFAPVVAQPGAAPDGTVSVTWSEADPNGEPVDSYAVSVQGAGGSCATTGRTSATCSGIPKGSTVSLVVVGTNVIGAGAPGTSPPIVAATSPSTPTTTIQGNGSTAAMTSNVSDNGGVGLTNMEIRRSGATIGTIGYTTSFNVDTPVGGNYTFAVRVQNASGFWSDWSGETRSVPGQGTPQIVQFYGTNGSNDISFTWQVADNYAGGVAVSVDGSGVGLNGSGFNETIACGTQRGRTMTVNYNWDGVPRSAIQAGATASAAGCPPPPTMTVAVSKGAGNATTQSGVSCGAETTTCRWANITASNFAPNTTYSAHCEATGTGAGQSFSFTTGPSGSKFVGDGFWFFGEIGYDSVTCSFGSASGTAAW